MKTFERLLWKMLWIHIALLFFIQFLHQTEGVSRLLNKNALYEGVTKMLPFLEEVEK